MQPSTNPNQQYWQDKAIIAAGYDPARFTGVEHTWWQNPLNPNSLRLTALGHKWFNKFSKFDNHRAELTAQIMPKQMIQLERLIKVPYYIQQLKVLYIYGEQDAVMLQLHGGDLNSYLDNLEANK